MTHSIRFAKGFSAAFLASIYILAFILTPYWLLHKSSFEIGFYLVLNIGVGLIWVFLSSDSFQIEFSSKDVWLFLLLLAGVFILNFRPLNSVIPYRGDETKHIETALGLAEKIPYFDWIVAVVLFLIFIVCGARQNSSTIVAGIILVACIILYFLFNNPFPNVVNRPVLLLRYPFINYWFFAIVPELASAIGSPYHEVLYRVIPLLAMVGTAWVVQRRSGMSALPSALGWGFAIATMPVVFYYSSILYIEPLAVLLMALVCLQIEDLLYKESKDILQVPGWYALLLIGFVKETSIPFILCYVAVRTIVQTSLWLRRNRIEKTQKTFIQLLIAEFGILVSLLTPAFLYMYYRTTLTDTRSYAPQVSNLFDASIYPVLLRSFIEQFGLFFLSFVCGCVLLFRKREFVSLLFFGAVVVATLAFHITDSRVYVGYSRFNLFILPSILAVSIRFISWASKQRQYMGGLLLGVTIGCNFLLSPVHLDGVKTAYWGNYLTDTSEHYYPYQDALLWLKNNHAKNRVLFAGVDFYYPFQFYWDKLDWKPRKNEIPSEGIDDETLAIASILKKAENEHYTVVVYRLIGRNFVLPKEMREFRVQAIQNSAHTVLIFYKP